MGEPHHQPYFDENWQLSGRSVHGYVTPSPAGPVPGVGFEGWRQGIDDYRYLQLLEARLDAAGPNSNHAAARTWLTDLRRQGLSPLFDASAKRPAPWRVIPQWESDFTHPHPDLSADDYDAIRAKAASFIGQLAAAPDELNPEPDRVQPLPQRPLESEAFAGKSIDVCLATLKSGSAKQRRQAIASLATRDPSQAKAAVPALIELLNDRDTLIPALRAIGHFGPHAAAARSKLEELTRSKDAFIRHAANATLERID